MIANLLTVAMLGRGLSYREVSDVIYGECLKLARGSKLGDWIELPDGTTFTCTFKPEPRGMVVQCSTCEDSTLPGEYYGRECPTCGGKGKVIR